MDIISSSMKFVSENVSCSGLSLKDLHSCAHGSPEEFVASDLGGHLTNLLNIEEDPVSIDERKLKFFTYDGGLENTHIENSENFAATNFATFPCSSKNSSSSESIGRKGEPNDGVTADTGVLDGEGSSAFQLHSQSKSLPTPAKLRSAMKGSREKLGTPPKKLSVKWAADVYDPVPTSVSHVPKNKPRHRSDGKKNGKNKYKNGTKSSRGHKSKDKKQVRKHGSGSNSKSNFHALDGNSILVSPTEFQSSIVDFDIGSPVPFCGTSFLNKSVPRLHFPLAEAT